MIASLNSVTPAESNGYAGEMEQPEDEHAGIQHLSVATGQRHQR